jgi:hypothetical protein
MRFKFMMYYKTKRNTVLLSNVLLIYFLPSNGNCPIPIPSHSRRVISIPTYVKLRFPFPFSWEFPTFAHLYPISYPFLCPHPVHFCLLTVNTGHRDNRYR